MSSHKADARFFERKRPWSIRKDIVLSYYLTPYLTKISTQHRPVLLVDAFAGPGMFDDKAIGSPVIICNKAKEANATARVKVRVLAIESVRDLYNTLSGHLTPFDFATARHARFLDVVPEIERAAATHNIFLYVDPYAIKGLEWAALSRLFDLLRSGKSVEILLNFNAKAFVRRGLSALAMAAPAGPEAEDDDDESSIGEASIVELDSVVGGDWWQRTIKSATGLAAQDAAIARGFCERLREHFREVCIQPIFARVGHKVPKFHLVFGSRSTAALRLMNEAMCKSREFFARAEAPVEKTLFETRPVDVVPNLDELPRKLLTILESRMPRGRLMEAVMRGNLGLYDEKTIRRAVQSLISSGHICTGTGKAKINDTVELWRAVLDVSQ